jgi:hypothetical protein
MPKVAGPCFSVEGKGALAEILTYQKRPSGSAVYGYKKPGDIVRSHAEPTAEQQQMRDYYREACEHWRMLSEEEKGEWREFVKGSI